MYSQERQHPLFLVECNEIHLVCYTTTDLRDFQAFLNKLLNFSASSSLQYNLRVEFYANKLIGLVLTSFVLTWILCAFSKYGAYKDLFQGIGA